MKHSPLCALSRALMGNAGSGHEIEWSLKYCLCKISITCLWPWLHNERENLVTSQTNEFTTSYRGELVPPVHHNTVKFNVLLTVECHMTPITPCKGFSHDALKPSSSMKAPIDYIYFMSFMWFYCVARMTSENKAFPKAMLNFEIKSSSQR